MRITDTHLAKKYLSLQDSCRSRALPFDLSLSELRKVYRRNTCAYTGVKLVFNVGDTHQLATLDRVIPSKGYVKGNLVLCSKDINVRKGNLSKQELTAILKVVTELS